MTELSARLDPEIEELLREIAPDPKAQMLRARASRRELGLSALTEPILASSVSLTKAERHLLRAYREEVAWLLRQAAVRALMEDSTARRRLATRYQREILQPVPRASWQERAGRVTHLAETTTRSEGVDLIRSALAGVGITARAYCEVALRVSPSDESAITHAFSLATETEYHAAIKEMTCLLQRPLTASNSAYACSVLGLAHASVGNAKRANEAYRAGALASDQLPMNALSWLNRAARTGDVKGIREAAVVVDETIAPNHPALVEFVSLRVHWVGGITSRRGFMAILDEVKGSCGVSSGKILEAYSRS